MRTEPLATPNEWASTLARPFAVSSDAPYARLRDAIIAHLLSPPRREGDRGEKRARSVASR